MDHDEVDVDKIELDDEEDQLEPLEEKPSLWLPESKNEFSTQITFLW